jgi:hypothetical protein
MITTTAQMKVKLGVSATPDLLKVERGVLHYE